MFDWARLAGLPMLGGHDFYVYHRNVSVRAHFWPAGQAARNSDDKHVVEVHIFEFNSTIYNLDIKVEFIKRIRSEKKFNSLEELKSQLEIDEIKIKAVFNLLR